MAKDKQKINTKGLEDSKITAQTEGVRKTVFESMLSGLAPSKLIGIINDAKKGDTTALLTLAEEMEERDSQYRTVLNTRKLQVVSTPYRIKSIDSQGANLTKIQEFIEEITSTPLFKKMLFHLMDGLGKGFSVVEVNYEYSDKHKFWVPASYQFKPPQWFTFDEEENLLLKEDDEGKTRELDSIKVIRHIPQLKSGLPIRGGLAFAAASLFVYKNYGLKDWASLIETFGMPIRLGKYGAGAGETEKEELLNAVSDIGVDFAAIIPEDAKIEFINGNPNSNGDLYLKYIEHLDACISKIVLGQTMTTDEGSSYSQASVHNETREIIQKADCIDLADTLNRDLIKPLVDLNFGEQEVYPYIEFITDEKEDRQVLADIVVKAHSVGMPFSLSDIRERLGLKEPLNDADKLAAPLETSLNFDDTKMDLNSEDEAQSDDYDSVVKPILAGIEGVLDNSKSIEDAISKMEEASLDTTKLEESLFKSSLKEFVNIFKNKKGVK